MAKVAPLQSDFSAGEFSPLLHGRVDSDIYKRALARCKGYIALLQGPITRRPGTRFIAEVKDSSKSTRLVRFEFSTTQAYIIEFGDEYLRFYKENAQIETTPGTPYEIASPYTDADLFQLKFTQSADVLYIAHPSYAPRKLIRRGHTDWELTQIAFRDGPFGPVNDTIVTLAGLSGINFPENVDDASSDSPIHTAVEGLLSTVITGCANNGSGLIRVTTNDPHLGKTGNKVYITGVVGTVEANGVWTITKVDSDHFDLQGSTFTNAYVSGGFWKPAVFTSSDVGRSVRFRADSGWTWVEIRAYISPAEVTVRYKSLSDPPPGGQTTQWRLGVWSNTRAPASVCFHEDRLFFAGSPDHPQRVDGSNVGDYENFAPTDPDGDVVSSHAVGFTLNSNEVHAIRNLSSKDKGMLVGTVGGEWAVKSASQSEALSPTSINAKQATGYGCADIQSLSVGDAVIFVQRAGKKFREMTYFFDADGFRCPDLTHLSEHITGRGVVELAYQKEPQPIIWAVRQDGALIGMTYERDPESLRVGWHRHEIGGFGDAAGSIAAVESVAVIPAPDGTRDEVWMIVRRRIDGGTVRYVECMEKIFDDLDDQQDAFFVDCGLTLDNPLTITAITKANPAVVSVTGHGLSNGDTIRISSVMGMSQVNGKIFTVAGVTTDAFELDGIDSTDYTTYVSGGEVRKRVSTVTGLDHLEGESVQILGDGAPQTSKTVASGAIILDSPAAVVHVGLGSVAEGQLLRTEAGAADGTALGKTRRAHRVGMLLHRSLGLKVGVSFDELDTWQFREANTETGQAPPLFSGIFSETLAADPSTENQICWRQDQPLPSTILAIMPQMMTEDR